MGNSAISSQIEIVTMIFLSTFFGDQMFLEPKLLGTTLFGQFLFDTFFLTKFFLETNIISKQRFWGLKCFQLNSFGQIFSKTKFFLKKSGSEEICLDQIEFLVQP